MYLHDTLQVCLLALASRYPDNLVESNRAILGAQAFCPDCRTAADVLAWLQHTEPALLGEVAHLAINAQKCEIYLTDRCEQTPAYWVHCRGKMPLHTTERSSDRAL